jgi:hypothetical protein
VRRDLGRRQHRVGDAHLDRVGAAERIAEQQLLAAAALPISCGTIRLEANSGTRPRLTNGIASRASSLT